MTYEPPDKADQKEVIQYVKEEFKAGRMNYAQAWDHLSKWKIIAVEIQEILRDAKK